jgi:3-hydroxyisobutyrate dehydrogenase-like beta-hydroxyacid dehydrogenase
VTGWVGPYRREISRDRDAIVSPLCANWALKGWHLMQNRGSPLGQKTILDESHMMVKVIDTSSGNSDTLQFKASDILWGNFGNEESSSLHLSCKTLQLISEIADKMNVPLFLSNLARQIYYLGKTTGFGGKSPLSVIKVYEEGVGMEV